ncbi:MAG: competence/damage-inducible protein A [Thermomicrobiales bacterium]|nr:competence/damage-inducible protein A [Thermomicrobiales bacterium]
MRAAVLSIGSELIQGFLTDTNATFLAQELSALGIELVGVYQVGDSLDRLVVTLNRALSDADLVITTGGIGPTDDDLTREAVSAIQGEQVEVDPDAAIRVREFFSMRGVPMPEQNIKQAWRIPSAELLANPMGTAPGWYVRRQDQIIVSMPGVPREMYRMWREQALPRIIDRLEQSAIVARTLKTIGIGESAVEQRIIDLVRRGYPTVATYAKDDGVHIRITAMAADRAEAEQAVAGTIDTIREALAEHVYGELTDELADALLRPIQMAGAKVAIWEAGNAGRLTNLIDESILADEVVAGARTTSFVSAAFPVERPDAEQTAIRCATVAATEEEVEYGVSVAVELTPGDTEDRAHGIVGIALVHPEGVAHRRHEITAPPHEVRRRATMWAADFLWSTLRETTRRHPE